ncbi:MAG: reverse transcriptase domain-containing protein [Pseudomonas sp.]|nr:reverse transcriptase domain-containing protein [Pseudomonas sp.]
MQANKGAAGIDGMTIDAFPAWVRSGNWKALKQQLVAGCYQPAPVRRVEIAKPDGGTRQLGIPTVTDRVIQQAIAQVLTPIFDPDFSEHSFGFRPGRNGQQAVKQVQSIIKVGRCRRYWRISCSILWIKNLKNAVISLPATRMISQL